jgi:hypothetical protein
MSDHFIRLIPTDPSFLPGPESRSRAQALLKSFMPQAQEVEVFAYDRVRFVDQGGILWECELSEMRSGA